MMLLVFTLDDWRCALDLSTVEKVYRAAAVTPLPDAPDIVLGIINIKGVVLPVIDVRQRFHLPKKKLTPDDRLIVAHSSDRLVVLVVDSVTGVIEYSEQDITLASDIVADIEYIEGVARLVDGMILIHNLARFLSLEEKNVLEQAIRSI